MRGGEHTGPIRSRAVLDCLLLPQNSLHPRREGHVGNGGDNSPWPHAEHIERLARKSVCEVGVKGSVRHAWAKNSGRGEISN